MLSRAKDSVTKKVKDIAKQNVKKAARKEVSKRMTRMKAYKRNSNWLEYHKKLQRAKRYARKGNTRAERLVRQYEDLLNMLKIF